MRSLLIFLFLFSANAIAIYSQGEANNWYFGQNAGITFNTTPPSALTDGEIDTLEGCTTISDATGQLLFYTDGITVWDRFNNIMQNGTGLKGDPSSTSSALIVPQPNSPNLYIVFTVDEPHHDNADNDPDTQDGDGVNDGFMYSIVDISLNGGLGAVVSGQKNIPLITYDTSNTLASLYRCSEKITAVKSDDCDSFWVITHFADTFYAFSVTQTGVNATPVTSRAGVNVPISGYRRNALGYLKASPEGNKLAVAHFGLTTVTAGNGPGKVLLYDFDNATGIVNNEIELFDGGAPYGVEFSQSGNKLYATIGTDDAGSGVSFLIQYDLTLPDAQIPSSGTRILNENGASASSFSEGALQLGPDGKIYRSLFDFFSTQGDYLGVIENPEEIPANVIYREQGILVNTDGNRGTRLGLPPFIQSIFAQTIDIINMGDPNDVNLMLCEGDTFRLGYQNIPGATYSWFENDVQISNTTNFLDITTTGNYRLEVDLNDGSCPLIGVANVTFFEVPPVVTTTLIQCDEYETMGDNLTVFDLSVVIDEITLGNTDFSVQFFIDLLSAQAGTPQITQTTQFENSQNNQQVFARVTNSQNPNCFSISTITLQVSNASIGDVDLRTCDDDGEEDGFVAFDLTQADAQILSGIPAPGSTVSYFNATNDALLNINPITSITNSTQNSQGDDIVYAKVVQNDDDCFAIAQVRLFVDPLPDIEVEDQQFLCENVNAITLDSGLTISANPSDFTFLWSTNETSETIQINQPGSYTVDVTAVQTGCTQTRTIEVVGSSIPTIASIEINDASDNNTVTVNAIGSGDYEYAIEINGFLSPYQDNPTFINVPPGAHTIYVRDKNGCLPEVTRAIIVVGFPKYFTPNGDPFHQSWNVIGASSQILSNAVIHIFDRYGKLIKQLRPDGNGWDGTYNGRLMPSAEYWFRVQLEDGRIVTGSFSLIR